MSAVLHVDGGQLRIDGRPITTRLPVVDAVESSGVVVVLYDPESDPRGGRVGTFHNLVAIDRDGTELWQAETAESTTGDCYLRIVSAEPLRASSWSSYECTLDGSGRVIDRVFTK